MSAVQVEFGLGLGRVDEGEGEAVIAILKLQGARDLEPVHV